MFWVESLDMRIIDLKVTFNDICFSFYKINIYRKFDYNYYNQLYHQFITIQQHFETLYCNLRLE